MSKYTPQTLRALAKKVCDEWDMLDWAGAQMMRAHASAWEALEAERDRLQGALHLAVNRYDIERKWHSARGGDIYPDADWVIIARHALEQKP